MMKKVRINANQVGLVYKDGGYVRMLTTGTHWITWKETVQLHSLYEPFRAPLELNIYLKDAKLANALHVVEVGDNEVALQYENGLLKKTLPAGRYAYWKNEVSYKFVTINVSAYNIPEDIEDTTLQHPLVSPYVRTFAIESYERGLLFVDGKYQRRLESGTYRWFRNSTVIHVGKVDIRKQQLELNGQEILSRDKAALRVNAWAQYRVTDIEKALLQNKEYERQLYITIQLALRTYISALTLDELLDQKEAAALAVMEKIQVEDLGVELLGFGIRDVILPGDMKDIMNQVLIAEKKAQATLITRREETAGTRSLLNTAKLMEDNPMLFKLKEMEYVEKIAEKIGTISVGHNGLLSDQLKELFVPRK